MRVVGGRGGKGGCERQAGSQSYASHPTPTSVYAILTSSLQCRLYQLYVRKLLLIFYLNVSLPLPPHVPFYTSLHTHTPASAHPLSNASPFPELPSETHKSPNVWLC